MIKGKLKKLETSGLLNQGSSQTGGMELQVFLFIISILDIYSSVCVCVGGGDNSRRI